MTEIEKLGELIFNGTVLFLSIAFGLFTLSIGTTNITIGSVFAFGIFVSLVLLFGILSLFFSFFGIKNSNITQIYVAGICFIVMILLLTFAFSQHYMSSLKDKVDLVPKLNLTN